MNEFKPNRNFRKDYNKLYKKDPGAANLLLFLCEMADESGCCEFKNDSEMIDLLNARFNNPEEYAL